MISLEWEEYLKFYDEQKRLEEYQKTRPLKRPKTTKLTAALHLAALIVLVFGFTFFLLFFSPLKLWMNVIILNLYLLIIAETYAKIVTIKFVECYQHYASEERRRKCKCVPSCSEYAILCLKKYELFYALLKIRKRLFVTCKGFDYIIDEP